MLLRRIFLFFIFLDFVALLVVGYWEYEIHFVFSRGFHVIEIQEGMKARDVASYLHAQGVIADENAFLFYLWDTRGLGRIHSGTYSISAHISIAEVGNILTGQIQVSTVRVTIPEGSNVFEIANALQQAGLKISAQDFIHEVSKTNFSYDFLPDAAIRKTLEGYLFPDTYEFRRDATAHEVVDEMLTNFQRRVVPEIEAQHARSLRDVVIMASVLEKEVQTKQDMQIVAGLLWKRLDADQALQVDATAIYGKKIAQYASLGISADFYNTYQHAGLPPTPISNPGIASIESALNPMLSDYWYYLSTPDGKTIFSRTLQEQEANRSKYLGR